MGAIAEALVAYVQPLLDQTDGSEEQLNKAFAIGQLCYNLSLTPEDSRDQALSEMRLTLKMDDEEFDDFRRSIVDPMIRRHEEMFPRIHRPSRRAFRKVTLHPVAPRFGRSENGGARRSGPRDRRGFDPDSGAGYSLRRKGPLVIMWALFGLSSPTR